MSDRGLRIELSTILNSNSLQRQPPSAVQSFDGGRRELGEPFSLKEDARAVVSDRWDARPGEEREQPEAAASRPTISAVDRDRTSASRARRNGANKRRPRSAVAPIVRAGLATVLAIAVVVTGTYFARSRISGAFVSKPMVTIVHEVAPIGQIAAPGPVTITPQPTVARFQDLVFPLPHLYGIYVINSGRLFELEALAGTSTGSSSSRIRGHSPDEPHGPSRWSRRISVIPARHGDQYFRTSVGSRCREDQPVRDRSRRRAAERRARKRMGNSQYCRRLSRRAGGSQQGNGALAAGKLGLRVSIRPVRTGPQGASVRFHRGRSDHRCRPMSGTGRGGEWKLLPRMPTASGRDRRIVLAGRASESSPLVVEESSSE